jgi:hypothetical protein
MNRKDAKDAKFGDQNNATSLPVSFSNTPDHMAKDSFQNFAPFASLRFIFLRRAGQ